MHSKCMDAQTLYDHDSLPDSVMVKSGADKRSHLNADVCHQGAAR